MRLQIAFKRIVTVFHSGDLRRGTSPTPEFCHCGEYRIYSTAAWEPILREPVLTQDASICTASKRVPHSRARFGRSGKKLSHKYAHLLLRVEQRRVSYAHATQCSLSRAYSSSVTILLLKTHTGRTLMLMYGRVHCEQTCNNLLTFNPRDGK